ncbi:TonB-dependent receptor [Piscinibacter defluvii]|uniref:TonB-dependent receptor n=1 Tax=Piscinibacter defluvii TaxID=1796922 RepID=UPI000FDE263A|nr:TonB-dependent receptor [Piscinibacter defluvii]
MALICDVAWRSSLVARIGLAVLATGLAGSGASWAADAVTLPRVAVTGSNFGFIGDELAAPLLVLTRADIERSGRTNLSDLLRGLTVDNNGSLTQAFAGAIAGGASGISLRGMSVHSTLVLIDGRRTTVYPLADDGQRAFVDLSSLPLAIVERIEVLKDGASAIYGSDAIAGVVNVILRREFSGVEMFAGAGATSRGDGRHAHWSGTYGFGNLVEEGRTAYLNVEARTRGAILQRNRGGTLSNLDLRSLGGPDLRGGVVQPGNTAPGNFTQTLVGMVAPLDDTNAQVGPFQLLPGCRAAELNYSGGCSWDTLRFTQIQPETRNLNLNARLLTMLEGGWHLNAAVQAATSWSEQMFGSTYVPQPTQTDPTTSNVVLPPSHPDNPFGPDRAAFLYYTFGDVGPRHTTYRTRLLRTVFSLEGHFNGWDVDAALGAARAETRVRYEGTVRTSVLAAMLASGRYRIGANASLNDPSIYAELSPTTVNNASSQLTFADLRMSRDLWPLPGGPLTLGAGIEARRQRVDNPGQPYALEGDVLGNTTVTSRGSRSVHSVFAEIRVPATRDVSIDLAMRHERYEGLGTSTTPKLGARWQLASGLAVRATRSQGIRVPSVTESGDSVLNAYISYTDPARCPVTKLPSDCLGTIRLSLSGNPSLKPETSRNWTLGVVTDPGESTKLSVDYFRIERSREIVIAPFESGTPIYGGPDLSHPDLPPPIVGFSLPFINSTATLVSGFDVDLRHRQLLGRFGQLTGRLQYTRLIDLTTTVGDARFEYAGTHGPTALSGNVGTPTNRAQLSLIWQRGRHQAGTDIQYVGAMRATDPTLGSTCLAQEANARCRVGSLTTVDLFASWRSSDSWEWIAHIDNLFDRAAPLDTVTYGGINYNPTLHQAGAIGRALFFGVRYRAK